MKKSLLYVTLWLMGIMGTLTIWEVDASVFTSISTSQNEIEVTYDLNWWYRTESWSNFTWTRAIIYVNWETTEYSRTPSRIDNCEEWWKTDMKCMFDGWYLEKDWYTKWTWYAIGDITVYAKRLPFEDLEVELSDDIKIIIMDRNLWATASWTQCSDTSISACGYHFQWWNNYWFAHDAINNSYAFPNRERSSSSPVNNWSNHVSTYYWWVWINRSPRNNWAQSNDNLWWWSSSLNADNLKQGPCPQGYHVPDTKEWVKIWELLGTTTNRNKVINTLALPMAGYRDQSSNNWMVMTVGLRALYSSSSPFSANESYTFYLNMWIPLIVYGDNDPRSNARSVRCFKDYLTQNITFDGKWWSTPSTPTQTIRWRESATEFSSGTRVNSIFDGWYTAEWIKVTTNKILSDQSVILYARYNCDDGYGENADWTACEKIFDVTINSNNSLYWSVSSWLVKLISWSVVATWGATLTLWNIEVTAIPETDTDEWDYEFVNWTNNCGEILTNDCTIFANFDIVKRSYTITWNYRDENWEWTTTGKNEVYRTSPTEPTIPTMSESIFTWYTFVRRDPILETVTWSTTYTATYTEMPKFEVKFLSWGNGTLWGTTTYTVLSWLSLADVSFVEPTKTPANGYIFSGWNPVLNASAIVTWAKTYTAIFADDKNNNGTPDENENPWIVTVHYVYSRGWEASADKTWIYLSGLSFSFTSPVIRYYTADVDTLTWIWKDEAQTFTVTYTPINDRNRNWIADEEETLSSWWSGWGWRRMLDDNSEKSEQDTEDSQPAGEASAETLEWYGYTQEFIDAYTFAYRNWITTQSPITNADMDWNLTRIAMAKMLSKFSINVVWMKPDETRINKFNDISDELDEQYDNWVTLAYQLGIMWINMPNNEFRPFDLVTRWEFATALSRILWWDKYNVLDTNNMPFYQKHIEALKKEWIITQINPTMNELRWYVMLMLLRSNTFN